MVPILLIDGAVPLDAPIPPHRLPSQLVVSEGVGREDQTRIPTFVKVCLCFPRIGTRCKRRTTAATGGPIKAARAEALRPGVVQERILSDFPAEICAAPEAGKSPLKMVSIEIDEVLIVRLVHAGIGCIRKIDELAPETSHGRAHLPGLGPGIARAGRQRQLLWNKFEVDGCIGRFLAVTARDVVEPAVAERPDVGIVRRHRGGYEHVRWSWSVVAGRRSDRMEVWQRRQIEEVGLILKPVVLIKHAADAADSPIIGRAEPQLMSLMSVPLNITPGRAGRETARRCGIQLGRVCGWIDAL